MLSLAEDVMALGTMLVAVLAPLLALVLVVVVIWAMARKRTP